MVKHNNMVPNGHFHKQWQNRVRVALNQPGRAKRRRLNRKKRIANIAPRPAAGPLRPIVRCPTNKYNTKVRAGRGFTIEELKGAKVSPAQARSIGISIDKRRSNKSQESLDLNIARLKEYMSRLVVFPRKSGKAKKSEVSKEELAALKQNTDKNVLPIVDTAKDTAASQFVEITQNMRNRSAVLTLRKAYRVRQAVARKRWGKKEADPNAVTPAASGDAQDDD